jgi:general secretion pathway protein K
VAGVVAGLDLGSAKRIVNRRPFKTLEAARGEISREGALDPKRLSVGSSYFEISGRLRMDGRLLEERLLVKRQNREIAALMRSRRALQPGLE